MSLTICTNTVDSKSDISCSHCVVEYVHFEHTVGVHMHICVYKGWWLYQCTSFTKQNIYTY